MPPEQSGPHSRLETAEQRLADLQVAGATGALLRDAEIILHRTQAAVARAEAQLAGGAGMEQRFETFLRSTRFMGGGGAMPLMGRTADLLGISGPLLSKLTIAGTAISAFAEVVKTATEHVGSLGQAARLSGGSAGDVGFLAGFGLHGEATAGRAAAFHNLISQPGFAMATAARIPGMTPGNMLPRPFGDVNEAHPLKLAVQYLESLGPTSERLRVARIFEMEWSLRYLDAGKRTRAMLDELIASEEKLANPKFTQSATDLALKTEILAQKWDVLKTKMGLPFMDTMNEIMDTINDPSKRDQKSSFFHDQGPIGSLLRMLGLPETAGGMWDKMTGKKGSSPHEKLADAIERNTDAVKENTNGILGPGRYGGGARAARAVPAQWQGYLLDRALESEAIRKRQVTV